MAENIQFLSSLEKPEQLEDYLNNIAIKNEKLKSQFSNNSDWLNDCFTLQTCVQLLSFNWGKSIDYISNLCELWNLSMEIRFTAFEILNKFLTTLLQEICLATYPSKSMFRDKKDRYQINFDKLLYQFNCNDDISLLDSTQPKGLNDITNTHNLQPHCSKKLLKSTNCLENLSENALTWKDTINRVQSQMELRAVTCISIASKFDSHYHKLKSDTIIKFLRSRGYEYKTSILVKSEIRILKSFNFNVNSLPLVFPCIGAILESLFSVLSSLNSKEIYKTCQELLLCFYQQRPQVYINYWKVLQKKNEDKGSFTEYLQLSSDMIMLGCTIIASAVYLHSKQESNQVVEILSNMANIKQEDLAEFSHIMLETLLSVN